MGLWVDEWGHVKSLKNRINLEIIEMWSQALAIEIWSLIHSLAV